METMKIEIAKMLLNIYIYDASISYTNIMYNAFYVLSAQMQIHLTAGRDEAIIQNTDKPSFSPMKGSEQHRSLQHTARVAQGLLLQKTHERFSVSMLVPQFSLWSHLTKETRHKKEI